MGSLGLFSISKMKPSYLSVSLAILSLVATSTACCCTWTTQCNCNIFGCDCVTHDGDWCYYWDSNDVCSPLKHEHCNAFTTMQHFGRWDMNKDGTISASEAWEYGKDQDGFIIP